MGFTGKGKDVSTLIVNGVRFRIPLHIMSKADTYSDNFVTIAFGNRQFRLARWRDACFAVNSSTL
jgi:hypothetical protein